MFLEAPAAEIEELYVSESLRRAPRGVGINRGAQGRDGRRHIFVEDVGHEDAAGRARTGPHAAKESRGSFEGRRELFSCGRELAGPGKSRNHASRGRGRGSLRDTRKPRYGGCLQSEAGARDHGQHIPHPRWSMSTTFGRHS